MTPWTVASQVPLFMDFSRQEYWSELSFPSPGDLPNPGIEPGSSALQADSFPAEPLGKPKIQQDMILTMFKDIVCAVSLNTVTPTFQLLKA